MTDDRTALKRQAAEYAVQYVQSGMIVGLGHGSTAVWAVRHIAHLLKEGKLRDILGVPTSSTIKQEAKKLGIPLTTLEEHPVIDLTIDGADEVSPTLNLIKGGGGALLQEKIVAQASKVEIIVVDNSKLSEALGTQWAVPVEVIPFGWRSQAEFLDSIGGQPELRLNEDGTPFQTDQQNYILDCHFGVIKQPYEIAAKIKSRTGIVEHGLFLDIATAVIVASANGIQHLKREQN